MDHTTPSPSRVRSYRMHDLRAANELRCKLDVPPRSAREQRRISVLAGLEGFLKVASVPDWRRVRLIPVTYPVRKRPPPRAADVPTPAEAAPVLPTDSAAVALEPVVMPAAPVKRRAPAAKRARKGKNGGGVTKVSGGEASAADPDPAVPTSRATRVTFRGKRAKLIHHLVYGVLQFQKFAAERPR